MPQTTPFTTEPSDTAFSLGYNSYAIVPLPTKVRSKDIIEVRVTLRTLIEEGCIFYVTSGSNDQFFTVYMKTGQIHFHYENDRHSIMLPSKEKYNTNTDIRVIFKLEQSTGTTSLEVLNAETGDQQEFKKKVFGIAGNVMIFEDKMNVGTVSNVL